MTRKDLILIALLFLIGFGLRCYDLSYPGFCWMDECAHVPAATHYCHDGQFEPDLWEHPPLRHLLLYGFLEIFGDNPYGWRMRNVLFGAMAPLLTFLFAHQVSGSRRSALLAGLLMATDPLHIVLSRYTFEEIYGGVFFLASIILYLQCRQRSLWLVGSALLMGCALAIKWYYVPCWLVIGLLALREHDTWRDFREALFVASTWIILPCSVYLLTYYPWFGRGYSPGEFLEFIANSYLSLQLMVAHSYDFGLIFLSHTSALEWFTIPMDIGQGTYLGGDRGEFILYMNDAPVWLLTLPSLVITTVLALRRRNLTLALPALFFCATYSLFLIVRRPAFLYSAIPLLPFAFTAIAATIQEAAQRYGTRIYYSLLALLISWNLYLYPLVTAKKVPMAPYRYLITRDVKLL